MDELDYITELASIRGSYVESRPAQRLHILSLRLANPEHGPNLLVTHVSAVEALARSLAMHRKAKTKADLRALYPSYRNRKAESLVSEYVAGLEQGSPAEIFGESAWRLFGYAVTARNLLVHECTYLGQDKYPQLIQACDSVIATLCKLSGLPRKGSQQ